MGINFPRSLFAFTCFGAWLCLPGCQSAPPAPPQAATTPGAQQPLPAPDAVAFLEMCLERYDRQGIRGYRLRMHKQERIGGKLQPPELIDAAFRARPYSVFLRWLEGARGASAALYVEGQNDNKMLVRPTGLAGFLVKVAAIDPDGSEARRAARYSIKDFGLRKAVERTLKSWKAAKAKGTLRVAYLGVQRVADAGDRPCYTLRRTMTEPDEEGIKEVTVSLDTATWFQVGTVLRGEGGGLIGEYVYRDIQLNPTFPPEQFEPAALTSER